jgi:serine/threonine-protein kinase PknG
MDPEKCQQPGCEGVIDAGFCNVCGLEPPAAPTKTLPAKPGSATLSASVGSSRSGRTGSSPSRRGTARGSSRRHLGLGMVAVPAAPALDPEKVVMAVPEVPSYKRFCPNPDCTDGQGGPTPLTRRTSGHCPQCGRRYSFVPTLNAGDVVAEQYLVRGCLAYGGLGWIYLAKDTTLGRWVVLKGLLNTADEAAAAAAVAERKFLAAVKHANVVGIYNFVKKGAEGFIVMEYVGGQTLKEVRKARGPLPAAEAIAYVHRILGAFGYLHRQGLVYCDFKPDNFMIEGDPPDVKLIDMGGVRRMDDTGGDVYGTVGYSAPEAADGPTVSSDLYTVGRTLAVLLMDFRYQGAYVEKLPTPAEQPVLARHEPLYRFLLKATASDPDRRFQSAEEMADQLAGVLRMVSSEGGEAHPADSTLFGPDPLPLAGDDGKGILEPAPELLPDLKVDPEDAAAGFVLTTAGVADPARRVRMLREAQGRFTASVELPLRLARDLIAAGSLDEAEALLAELAAKDPFDWSVNWLRGRAALARGEAAEARKLFDGVYGEVPGEPAAQQAVAVAAELAGDGAGAIRLYDLISRTDPNFASAAFGLARCLAAAGRREEAAKACGRIPPTSSLYVQAQETLARVLVRTTPRPPGSAEFRRAAEVLDALASHGAEDPRLRAEVLQTALSLLESRSLAEDASVTVFGQPLREAAVRRLLEGTLRRLAKLEGDRARQIELVDRANRVRPLTWV